MCPAFAPASVRFPGEWEPHAGTILAWPHDALTFPSLEAVEGVFETFIRLLSKNETVRLLAHPRLHPRFSGRLSDVSNLSMHNLAAADAWMRDTAPIFVKRDGKSVATCWQFNAWGNRYPTLLADNGLNQKIAAAFGFRTDVVPMVLEGGSIDSNGTGLCLTSEQCLLNKNRNPLLSKDQIEANLKGHLGFSHVLWLKDGVADDDTDGHVDDFARFANARTVVHAVAEKDNPNYAAMAQNQARLKRYAKHYGLKLVPLPLPEPWTFDGELTAASHCNFYIANGQVLVPVFKQKSDKAALSILREVFPERKITGLDCRKIIEGGGSLHCLSQQVLA